MNTEVKEQINPLLKETFIFRPLETHQGMLRYAGGKWIPDDGEPDLAFIYHDRYPAVEYIDIPYYTNLLWEWSVNRSGKALWHYATIGNKDWRDFYFNERRQHPNEVAGESGMSKCASMYGCANGCPIGLIHKNDYITQGKLTIQATGEPVRMPSNPVCFLCLNNGYGHRLQELLRERDKLEGNIEVYEDEIKDSESRLYDARDSLKQTKEELEALTQEINQFKGEQ